MYKIYINEEITGDSYYELIDYAMSKSDAFMLVVYRYSEDIESVYEVPDRSMFEDDEIYEAMVKWYERSKKEAYIQMNIFNSNTKQFISELDNYLISKRNVPTKWPGIEVVFSDDTKVDIYVYRICHELRALLLKPKELFKWKYPYFPDDLSFFKNGYCWFFTVAHENYSFMFVESDEEIRILERMGINFKVEKYDGDETSLFYEEYKL